MTKEQLVAAGLTEEQADSVLAMRGSELTNLRNQISDLTQQNTQLQADSAELATLKQQNLTAEQLQQQAIDEANAEKEKYQHHSSDHWCYHPEHPSLSSWNCISLKDKE